MFASVLDADVVDVKPSAFAAFIAVTTMRAESACAPVGRIPIVSILSESFAACARGPVHREFSAVSASCRIY
jgi:hypothetical protein